MPNSQFPIPDSQFPIPFWLASLYCLLAAGPVAAQPILPDATLPENSRVRLENNTFFIEGGTEAGANLFHSFEAFSIPPDRAALFNNAAGIVNIFSRVTGGSISQIDGSIGANGRANLFFLNPNGIVFGPNASLNLGGSFLATTASAVTFADGSQFGAAEPQAAPLLTVSVPIGLQFGASPGNIVSRSGFMGSQSSEFVPPGPPPENPSPGNFDLSGSIGSQSSGLVPPGPPPENPGDIVSGSGSQSPEVPPGPPPENFPVGLQVRSGNSLAIVGGEIDIEGGILTAPQGRIELGAVGENSHVSLTQSGANLTLAYDGVDNFQNIQLSRGTLVDARGDRGGDIQLQGKAVDLLESSRIIAETQGNIDGGDITIGAESLTLRQASAILTSTSGSSTANGGNLIVKASESIELIGDRQNGFSLLGTATLGLGNSGNANIQTRRLLVRNGARLSSSTFAAGNAGDIFIRADDLVEVGGGGIFSQVNPEATGNGGNVTIETTRLAVQDGGQVSAGTLGRGEGGDLIVNASKSVEVTGASADGSRPSALLSVGGGSGDAGDLSITTERLIVRDGQVRASTVGTGRGGNLTANASESLEISGRSPDGLSPAGLLVTTVGAGNSGNLTVNTQELTVRDGAAISARTSGEGNGGTVVVNASDSVEIIGAANGEPSRLSAGTIGSGAAGNVTIATGRLTVREGAEVGVNGIPEENGGGIEELGAAGNLEVEAEEIFLDEGTLTAETTTGRDSNITLNSDEIRLENGSKITTDARNAATGGNIEIDTDILTAIENSDITANAEEGSGGRVEIEAVGVFGATANGGESPSTSDITATSEAGPELDGIVEINSPDVDPTSGLEELEDEAIDTRNPIEENFCQAGGIGNQLTIAGRGSMHRSPSDPYEPSTIWRDTRSLIWVPERPVEAGEPGSREQGSRGAGEQGSRGAGEQRSRGAGEQAQGERGSRGAGEQGSRGAGEQGSREQGSRGAEEPFAPTNSTPPASPTLPTPPTPATPVEARGWVEDDRGRIVLTARPPGLAIQGTWSQKLGCRTPTSNSLSDPTNAYNDSLPKTIEVRQFRIEGNTALSDGELIEELNKKQFLNRPLSFPELLASRSLVTELYTKAGYITSGALIPEQTFKDGTITIQVLEGNLEEIYAITQRPSEEKYIKSRLGRMIENPLNRVQLLGALQWLREDRAIKNVQAELSPEIRSGRSILDISIVEANPWEGEVSLDNGRAPSVGSFRRGARLGYNNLLRFGDRLGVAYSNTDGSNSFDFRYALPVNPSNGSTLELAYSNGSSDVVEPPFDRIDLAADSRSYALTYRQPLLQRIQPIEQGSDRSFREEFALGIGASRRESQTSLLGFNYPVSPGADDEGKTGISALRFFQDYTRQKDNEVFAARSQFNLGIGWLGATVNDGEPDSQFFNWRGQLQWLRLLGSEPSRRSPRLLVRSDIQLSTELVPLEQFSLGGLGSARGYRQDALLADNGAFASAEFWYPLANWQKGRSLVYLIPFIDTGAAWNSGSRSNPDTNILASVGLGLQLELSDRLVARLDYGLPLVELDSQERTWQENGLYFSIRFNPF